MAKAKNKRERAALEAEERRAKVKELHNRKLKVKQISEQLGVPLGTIYDDLKDLARRGEVERLGGRRRNPADLSMRNPAAYDVLYAYKYLDWPDVKPDDWEDRAVDSKGNVRRWRPRPRPKRMEAESMLGWARENRPKFLPMAIKVMEDYGRVAAAESESVATYEEGKQLIDTLLRDVGA